MKRKLQTLTWTMLALLFFVPSITWGKNIDLVTLPARSSIELTIYNSADLTLVKETRYITFKKGSNRLQFSWSGTLIDPTSVEMRPLQHADEIDVIDTKFPGQKPTHLIWNVNSTYEGQVKVEVSYFTSGLTWQMDYVGITNAAESTMNFRGYVRVYNRSGETYPNAQVRLIVGKINLVEKIKDLARRSGYSGKLTSMPKARYKRYRWRAARRSFDEAARVQAGGMAYGQKQIVKQGLSEYFMFTVGGKENVKNGWSKRLEAVKAAMPSFQILYRLRTHQYGSQPVRFFIWKNSAKFKLGESPLPDGKIRLFKKGKTKGLSYLGEQKLRYVPIKGSIEINLGVDPLVMFQQQKTNMTRSNFDFSSSYLKEYVSGWDESSQWTAIIRNYRKKPITVEWHQRWYGDYTLGSQMNLKKHDYRTTKTTWTVASLSKSKQVLKVVQKKGSRYKQSRIVLTSEQ
ncbi:MAG: hypothetical protein EP343_25565 [Deltaproteobacteria bacterium]|nr:MAG: hypothetical protein EP343_25565 [Deltaproteobacteria bacterium]